MLCGAKNFVQDGSWNILILIQAHSKRENKDEIKNYIFRIPPKKKNGLIEESNSNSYTRNILEES